MWHRIRQCFFVFFIDILFCIVSLGDVNKVLSAHCASYDKRNKTIEANKYDVIDLDPFGSASQYIYI